MKIGVLAKRTGCKIETIRYYEQQGLLPVPPRSLSGQRNYAETDRQRLLFILRGRALGFGLAEIRELIGLEEDPDLSCSDVDRLARHHQDQVKAKLMQLRRLDKALDELITGCHGGQRADCAILNALSSKI